MRKISRSLAGCAAVAALIGISPSPVHACVEYVYPKLEDVRYADVVVIGRIGDYRVVRDEAFRTRMLSLPNLAPDIRKLYQDSKEGLLPDYARFEIQVEQVLVGEARTKLYVTWDNSTFAEPDRIKPGRYLIALRRANSDVPPLRGPSASMLPSPDKNTLTLLQAPCSSAFIYEAESEQAHAIRAILHAERR